MPSFNFNDICTSVAYITTPEIKLFAFGAKIAGD